VDRTIIAEDKSMGPINMERRKNPRFFVDLPVKYWRIDIPQSGPGRTGDISEGGVLLYLPEKIAAGQNIGVKIFIPTPFESQSIEAIGQAAWSDSQFWKKDFYHRAGLKFVEISEENSEELKNFLKAQMNLGVPAEVNIPPELWSPLKMLEMDEKKSPTLGEPTQEEGWRPLQQRKKETFSAKAGSREDDETKLSPELLYDLQEEYTEEQRQNLYHKIVDMGVPERQRLAILANRETRSLLIRDPNKMVSLNVLKNAKVNESEVLQYAQRRDLAQDIILAIAQDQKWKKNYPVKLALASNPKTPLSLSITFLSHLQEKDLKLLSRDNNLSSVLRRRAQEILHKKRGK
jgi:hypothetical protein